MDALPSGAACMQRAKLQELLRLGFIKGELGAVTHLRPTRTSTPGHTVSKFKYARPRSRVLNCLCPYRTLARVTTP